LVILAELDPLVVVLFLHGPLVRGWRNQFKSASVPVVILSVGYGSVRLPLFGFVFRSSLPDVFSRPGFDKKLDLMSPLRCEPCKGGQRLDGRDFDEPSWETGREKGRWGVAHSEVQGKRKFESARF